MRVTCCVISPTVTFYSIILTTEKHGLAWSLAQGRALRDINVFVMFIHTASSLEPNYLSTILLYNYSFGTGKIVRTWVMPFLLEMFKHERSVGRFNEHFFHA